MDHLKLYVSFFIFCVSSILIHGDVICPFGKEFGCTCSGDCANANMFETASCYIPYGTVISFTTPPATYTITERLLLNGYVWELKENAFVAFKSIGELAFEQLPAGYVVNWHENAFQGVKISKLTTIGLNNAERRAAALRNLGRNGLEGLRVVSAMGDEKLNLSGFEMRDFRKLTSLSIEHTPIEYIDDNAFVGFEYNLEQLTLINVELRAYPKTILNRLVNLRHLDLSDNNIVFPPDPTTFVNLSNLESLHLSGNDIQAAIESIPPDVLLPNLEILDLDRANLPEFPYSILQTAPSVKRLSLKNNIIHILKPMSSSPNLVSFDYDANIKTPTLISEVATTTKFTTQLTSLNLDGNPITQVIQGAMEPFPQVTALSMSRTPLIAIDLSAFDGMRSLSILSMDWSQRLRLFATGGQTIPTLTRVSLTHSALDALEPELEAMIVQPNFVQLDISDTEFLLCGKYVSWSARYFFCDPKRLKADNSKCADMQDKLLVPYLTETVQNPCAPPTPAAPITSAR